MFQNPKWTDVFHRKYIYKTGSFHTMHLFNGQFSGQFYQNVEKFSTLLQQETTEVTVVSVCSEAKLQSDYHHQQAYTHFLQARRTSCRQPTASNQLRQAFFPKTKQKSTVSNTI